MSHAPSQTTRSALDFIVPIFRWAAYFPMGVLLLHHLAIAITEYSWRSIPQLIILGIGMVLLVERVVDALRNPQFSTSDD